MRREISSSFFPECRMSNKEFRRTNETGRPHFNTANGAALALRHSLFEIPYSARNGQYPVLSTQHSVLLRPVRGETLFQNQELALPGRLPISEVSLAPRDAAYQQ
jgi:hypothetical protein